MMNEVLIGATARHPLQGQTTQCELPSLAGAGPANRLQTHLAQGAKPALTDRFQQRSRLGSSERHSHHLRLAPLPGTAEFEGLEPFTDGSRRRRKRRGKQPPRPTALLADLGRLLNQSYDLARVLARLLDRVAEEMGAERGLIMLDRGGSLPEVIASYSRKKRTSAFRLYSPQVVTQVLDERAPVVASENTQNPVQAGPARRSIACVPLTAAGRTLGVIYLECGVGPRRFVREHLEILKVIAEMVVVAIERSEFRAMLVQAEKLAALGTLVAGVAHELRSPLTAILIAAEMLEDRASASLINDQVDRCRTLADTLMDLSRREQEPPQSLELATALATVMPALRAEFSRRGVLLVEEIARDLPPVKASPNALGQVVVNLATNALQAVRAPGGTVTLQVTRSREGVRLVVSDDGPGIAPENLRRIFEPYFTTKGRGQGTGLGLSISRQLVEQVGARISASNRPDRGARFEVDFPPAHAPL